MGDRAAVNGDPREDRPPATESPPLSRDPQPLPMTGDSSLDRAVEQWLSWDQNPLTRAQIQTLLEQGQVSELRSRLGSRLKFGTAGLRARMGAGFNRINDLTVIQSTQGLCSYLTGCVPELKQRGVVIGFDTRAQTESGCSSERLAKLAAAVFLTADVTVHLFSSYTPTPYVPFAVVKLGAAAGIMITASHNHRHDNGYKVYWSNGAQMISPHDKLVLKSISEQLQPWSALCWSQEESNKNSRRTDPLEEINRRYMEELKAVCFYRELNPDSDLRVVHSSFHGVGHEFVVQAFQVFGLRPPIPVPEHKDPDPDFPTVSVPNPEEGASVLTLALSLADAEGSPLVLATDPDADRLAVAEKEPSGRWRIFSGNEIAALLGWWMLLNHRRNQDQDQNPDQDCNLFMLATTVSSKILQSICSKEGLGYEETLPGFKWIGNRIHELQKCGHKVLFSFEESIGFLCGNAVPEKDGVSAAAVVAEMATFLHRQNLSLSDQLHNIYTTYGYHAAMTSYVICDDPDTVDQVFSRIRDFDGSGSYPRTCGCSDITAVRDIGRGYDSRHDDNRSVLPVSGGHMITFWLQNGVTATLRTSGTENKIKVYAEICARPGANSAAQLEAELQAVVATLVDEFLEPEKNHLIRRSV